MPNPDPKPPTRLASVRWPAGLLERIDAAVPASPHLNRNALVIAAVEAALAPSTDEGTAPPTREQVREAIRSAQPYIRPDPAADAVMALLSRSAAGPSEPYRVVPDA